MAEPAAQAVGQWLGMRLGGKVSRSPWHFERLKMPGRLGMKFRVREIKYMSSRYSFLKTEQIGIVVVDAQLNGSFKLGLRILGKFPKKSD